MDENLKTIFYFAGTSGAGKSTRVYALMKTEEKSLQGTFTTPRLL